MSIKYAILGWLSWRPASGYDLKKAIAGSRFQPWSGNNNQIYTALLQLAAEGLAVASIEHREDAPTKKVYHITPAGLAVLKAWIQADVDTPEPGHDFLMRLAWTELLELGELESILARYEEKVRVSLLMAGQADPLAPQSPGRSGRENYVWDMIAENRRCVLEAELAWIGRLRNGLGAQP